MDLLTVSIFTFSFVVLIAFFGLFYLLQSKNQKDAALQGMLESMQNQQSADSMRLLETLSKNREEMSTTYTQSREEMANTFSKESSKINEAVQSIKERFQVVEEGGKQLNDATTQLLRTLNNPNTVGRFGEQQLEVMVEDALPREIYEFQYSGLPKDENGRAPRPDCYIKLSDPPGPICIDSKFPSRKFQAMIDSETDEDRKVNTKEFESAVEKYIKDIAGKYIIPDVTSAFAIMFVPSESIFAEIHKSYSKLIETARENKVYITSPGTLMAVLNTIRAVVSSMKLQKEAKRILEELENVAKDSNLLNDRAVKLEKHFNNTTKEVHGVVVSSKKIHQKIEKLKAAEDDYADDSEFEHDSNPSLGAGAVLEIPKVRSRRAN